MATSCFALTSFENDAASFLPFPSAPSAPALLPSCSSWNRPSSFQLQAFAFLVNLRFLLLAKEFGDEVIGEKWILFFVVPKLCLTPCSPRDCSTPGFPVLHCPRVCSDSRPLSQWCYLTLLCCSLLLLPSVFPQHQGLFKEVDLFNVKHIPHIRVWAVPEGERALKYGIVSFYELGNFIR